MLAWLTAASGDPDPSALLEWAKAASQIGFTAGVVLLGYALWRRLLVPFSWVIDLRAQMAEMKADYEERLAQKRAQIEAKDAQLAEATRTIVQETVPAVVRSQLTLEHVEAELRARRT